MPTPADPQHFVRNPIDAFVLAKLTEKKLTPSAPADKAALLRRVTYDLTGLPPSPAEMDAFLADASPAAYEEKPSTACSLRWRTANAGAGTGWTSPAIPTPAATG